MSWFNSLVAGVRSLFARHRVEQELDEELDLFQEQTAEHNQQLGMTPDEARRAARVAIGSRNSVKQKVWASRWEIGCGQHLERCASRHSFAATDARVHGDRGYLARAWHRREYGHFHVAQCRHAAHATGRGARPTRSLRRWIMGGQHGWNAQQELEALFLPLLSRLRRKGQRIFRGRCSLKHSNGQSSCHEQRHARARTDRSRLRELLQRAWCASRAGQNHQ